MANEVVIKVTGDTRHAEKGFDDLTRKITGISNTVTNLIAGGVMARIGGAIIGAAADSQRVLAQLDQVLKSTGMVAGVTREAVIALADETSRLTGIDDEAIISAQNMLLTFTNIHADVFPATTRAVLDMATAMNGGALPSMEQLRGVSIQVGKALQDPVEGVTALQRVGVRLTEGQKATIEKMVEMNDVAGAQALILQELQTEFGGSAEAAGKTFAGALGRAQTALGNMAEEIGGAVLPSLTTLVNAFADTVPKAIHNAMVAIEQLRAIFLYGVGSMIGGIGDLIEGFDPLAAVIDGISTAWAAFQEFIRYGITPGSSMSGSVIRAIPIRERENIDRLRLVQKALLDAAARQVDIANQAAETRAGPSSADLFKRGPRPGAYSIGGPAEGAGGGAGRGAGTGTREREPSILDLPELMRRSFPQDFFTRIVEGFDVITPEVQATLDDWRRQYNEFGRDSAILLQEITNNGTAQSQVAIQQFWAIIDAWSQLPAELQGPIDTLEAQFRAILDREATYAREIADTQREIWEGQVATWRVNLQKMVDDSVKASKAAQLALRDARDAEVQADQREERAAEKRSRRRERQLIREAAKREGIDIGDTQLTPLEVLYKRLQQGRQGFGRGRGNEYWAELLYRLLTGRGLQITRDGRLRGIIDTAGIGRRMGAGGLA